MSNLILPEGAGKLAAPAAAIEHQAKRQRTLVPALWQRADWPDVLAGARQAAADRLVAHGGNMEKVTACFHDSLERQFYGPGSTADVVRSHHRVMHIMTKAEDKPLCRCSAPDGYPLLRGLTQEENQVVMTFDRNAPQWHRLQWCNPCVTWARFLTVKNYGPQAA